MLKEFKEFATRGNIMDLAVGVVIGGAFQSIITSLVNDIIMPAISILTGKVDFSDMMFTVGEASIKYGNFITAIVNFLIIAGQVEKISKKLGKTKKEEPIPEPTVKICPFCYSEIPYKATKCAHCTSDIPVKE